MTVDISVEPVTGWRLWGLSSNPPGTPVLNPAGAGLGEWPARRRYEARCAADSRFGPRPFAEVRHVSPSLGCTCGIYASASLRDLMTSSPALPALSVVGTVSMWGRTIEHKRGWRSEYAYPARLTLVCALCLRSGSGEGKPAAVALGVYGRALVAVCSDHGGIVAEGESLLLFDPEEVQGRLLDRYAVDLLPFDAVRVLFERVRVPAPVPRRPPAVSTPPPAVGTTPPPAASPAPVVIPVSAPAAPASTKDPLWLRFTKAASAAVSFCLGLGFVVFMVIASLQSCIVSVDATEAAPITPAPVTEPVTEPVTDASSPTSKSIRWVRPEPLPEFAFVCGRPHGGWIELVDCSRAAPLTGSAVSPPDDSCFGEPVAITLRSRYSICWMSFGEPVAVDSRAAAANPFDEEAA